MHFYCHLEYWELNLDNTSTKKIAIITTLNHNIGDDFVREGIKYLLKEKLGDNISFSNIHKHSPITTRNFFEIIKSRRISNIIDSIIPIKWTRDKIIEADIVVQSGAPVYWCHKSNESHCCNNEWYKPLIKNRFLRYTKSAKLLNLAAGSCQKYNSDGSEFCEKCNDYIKEFYKISSVTTLRDSLAKDIFSQIDIKSNVLPCSSIFAIDEYGLSDSGSEYIVLNYMKGGAHYTFGQNIDFKKWELEFSKFYFEIKKYERVIFSCHNKQEVDLVMKFDPEAEIFYKKNDYLAYMKFYSKAKFGIMNRVHGAFLISSFGKPSLIIGNDSRAKMADEIGLKNYFVNDVSYDILMQEYKYLNSGADNYKERFRIIKEKAYKNYMKELSIL